MGRKQTEFKLKRKHSKANFETRKNSHRFSDSKYRHNVQYLFDLLKHQVPGPKTKDSTLIDALDQIKDIENEVFNHNGSEQSIDMHREEFFNLLSVEETIWRKERNVIKWWHKMQEFLKPLHLPKKTDAATVVSNFDIADISLKATCFNSMADIHESEIRDMHELMKSSDVAALSYNKNDTVHEDDLVENSCAKQDKILENAWNLTFHEDEYLVPFQASPTSYENVEYNDFNAIISSSASEESSVSFSTEVANAFLEHDPLTSFESSFQNLPSLVNTLETFDGSRRNENKAEVGKDFPSNDIPSYEPKQVSLISRTFLGNELPLDRTVVQVQGLNLTEQNFLSPSSVFFVL